MKYIPALKGSSWGTHVPSRWLSTVEVPAMARSPLCSSLPVLLHLQRAHFVAALPGALRAPSMREGREGQAWASCA